jgi:competence protein ComEC
MKRPLVLVALLYGGGLLLAEWFRLPLFFLFSLSFALAAAAIALPKRRSLLVWPLIIFSGWTNLTWRTHVISPHDLRNLISDPAEDVAVRGILLETPDERLYVRNGKEMSRTLIRVSVTAIQRGDHWQPAFGKIVATTRGQLPKLFFGGQTVEVRGVLASPAPALADGLFDYRNYLRRQSIYFELKVESPGDWQLVSTNSVPPLSDRFLAWAKRTLGRGLPGQDKPLRLLWAMTLGSKNVLTADAYDPFVQSGTMHIFAISGLHIALIAGILISLLRVIQISRVWCGAGVIPAIWFYTAATGWQPSAVRSGVMMSIIIAGWSLKRPSDLINSLAAAALIILLGDPQQLFQAGFQLSFFVVLSIALLMPPLETFRDRLLRTDPMLPAELLPLWRRWLAGPLRAVTTFVATSIAAWLGSWLLTAYYFHLFSPVTLLANLLVVPLSTAALACNLGSLICGSWFPYATELFNHSGWFWMWLMMKISEMVVRLPGAFFYVPSPAPIDFGIYYTGLGALLSGVAFKPNCRAWTASAVAVIIAYYGWRCHAAGSTTSLTILPVNGGAALYCDAPGQTNDLLIDCGSANSVEFVTIPFLHAQGVNRLPCLVLTHGDLRCVGGAENLQTNIITRQVAFSPVRFRSPAYRRIIQGLQATPEKCRILSEGDRLNQWTILHPRPDDHFAQADDQTLVLRGQINGVRVLLLSDLGKPGQSALLERKVDMRADIVVTGLPEQGDPLGEAVLDAVQPRLIIVTDSEFPATKRAKAPLLERLRRRNIPILCTRETGAISLVFQRTDWSISTARDPNGKRAIQESES